MLIAGGAFLVLTLTAIGIGVGLYLGSSGVGQFVFASQSIVFVNYVFRSDGTKLMQNETETGMKYWQNCETL